MFKNEQDFTILHTNFSNWTDLSCQSIKLIGKRHRRIVLDFELAFTNQQLVEASHRAEQTLLTAPVTGTVQQLAIHSLGGVVTPAEALLTVVPDGVGLLVEAHIQNKDIGFIHAGQDVALKVQAFEFTRYGLIHGMVLDVSHDAMATAVAHNKLKEGDPDANEASDTEDSQGGGYIAHVALARSTVITEDGPMQLGPGMSVTVEIKTGQRRLISYLLSPLQRYAHDGAKEDEQFY